MAKRKFLDPQVSLRLEQLARIPKRKLAELAYVLYKLSTGDMGRADIAEKAEAIVNGVAPSDAEITTVGDDYLMGKLCPGNGTDVDSDSPTGRTTARKRRSGS